MCIRDRKSPEELAKEKIDLEKVKTIPFQALVQFTSTKGDRVLRVITQQQRTTMDQAQTEKEVNVRLLGTRCTTRVADLALAGELQDAESHASDWNMYVNNVGSRQRSQKASEDLALHNFKAKKVMTSVQVMQSRKSGMPMSYQSSEQQLPASNRPPSSLQQPQSQPSFLDRVKGFFSKEKPVEEAKEEEESTQKVGLSAGKKQVAKEERKHDEQEVEDDEDEANKNLIQARMNKFI
eukprot:TRINITY_DN1846_c0_g1_i1.p1 TRINITY_DN1846_c0_g1~~TRINITY_DN1846_c0_g1_i1.p1  ORF type:complete len:257 (-),score=90.99 TRINITY_DN1846_c0_g1_i1:118-828(-)